MRPTTLISGVLLLFAAACSGSRSDRSETRSRASSSLQAARQDPARLVHEYVERDANGQRLAAGVAWFDSAVAWREEPGYDTYTVIAGYQTFPTELVGDTAHVKVQFNVLGWVKTGTYFTATPAVQSVTFVLVRSANGWVITAPQMNQHVLAQVVLRDPSLSGPGRRVLDSLAKATRRE